MSEKQQVPCGDECCGEIGANSRALKHALSETPMQSDQIVMLANAVRLLAFGASRLRASKQDLALHIARARGRDQTRWSCQRNNPRQTFCTRDGNIRWHCWSA